ncbi:MAG: 6-bladed beta-propeller [Marinilabiliaceae bacterium]|jgi:hypothetical protein|nr:6-bladed beta-propeller [Marinilabiliaceae bacterium]
MKTIRFSISLLGIIILLSCNKNDDTGSLYELNLVNLPERELLLSDLVSDIGYIPLEGKDDALISWINGVRITEDLIIVWDYTKIFIYNRKGELKSVIDKRGRGPGEYPSMLDVDIDPESRRLTILSSKSLYSYNIDDGDFIETTTLPGYIFAFKIMDKEHYYFGFPPVNGQPQANNTIVSNRGDTLHKRINNILFSPDVNVGFMGEILSYRSAKGIYFKEMMNDTLFSITLDRGFQPYAVFNTGQYRLTPQKRIYITDQRRHELMFTDGFFETKNHLFIGVAHNRQNYLAALNKSSGEEYRFENGIENNIDGGLPLKLIHICNDTLLIGIALAADIINHQPDASFSSSEFSKLKNNINENDNPVLVVYNLK